MVLRFHRCAVASDDRDGVLVVGRRRRQDRQIARQRVEQRQQHRRPASVALVSLSKYCSRLPVYSGIRSIEWSLHRGNVGLAAADAELAADVETVGLQRLRVDLGDDLGLGEVGGAHLDRLQVTRDLTAAERIGAAARRQHHERSRRGRPAIAAAPGSSGAVHANVLSASSPCLRRSAGLDRNATDDGGFIRRAKGQDGSMSSDPFASSDHRPRPARLGPRRRRDPHAPPRRVRGPPHQSRRAVVGADRRLPHPDRAADLHRAEHRVGASSPSSAGTGACPLGVAILFAAVAGGLLTVAVGAVRIFQLRRAAKKNLTGGV